MLRMIAVRAPRPVSAASNLARPGRHSDSPFVWCATALVLWGIASFGAVYDWACTPLLLVASVSAAAMLHYIERKDRGAVAVVTLIILALLAQAVPLPDAIRAALTSADTFTSAYQVAAPQSWAWAPLSVAPTATLSAAIRALVLALLCITLAASLRHDVRAVACLARNILIVAAVFAVEAIVQKGASNGKIYWFWESNAHVSHNYFGPFVNRNHFAGWMILAASLSAGWLMGETNKAAASLKPGWRRRVVWLASSEATTLILATAALLVTVIALIGSMSRSGIAGGVFAMLTMALVAGSRMNGIARRLLVPSAVIMLLMIAIETKGAELLAGGRQQGDGGSALQAPRERGSDQAAVAGNKDAWG